MGRRVLSLFVLIGALACAVIAGHRWSLESSNRTVEVTLEWPEIRSLSAALRTPMPVLLQHFRSAGVTSVAFQEQTIHELVDDGDVFRPDPFTDRRVQRLLSDLEGDVPRRTVLGFPDARLQERVQRNLAIRWGADRIHPAMLGRMNALVIDGEYAQFRDLGVGLDPDGVAQARSARMAVVGRVKNYPALTESQIRQIIDSIKREGAHAVIFSGEDVLGNPNLIHQTAATLLSEGVAYGYVEFGKQHGDDKLTQALRGNFIRVHTISGAELSNMTPNAAIARFVKAVRERDIRLCYVHLLSSVTGGTLEGDEEFVGRIASGIRAGGYSLGVARILPDWTASRVLISLAAVGLVSAALLLCWSFWRSLPLPVLVFAAVVLLGLLAALPRSMALQAGALMATLVFPTYALVWASFPSSDAAATQRFPKLLSHPDALVRASTLFLATCALSALGALYVIGFLGETLFMTKTDQFIGIKPAIVLPVIAVGLIYWGGLVDRGPMSVRWERLKDRSRRVFAERLTLGHVLVFGIALVVLGLLVARSGNDSAVGASVFELKTRRIMDGLLVARPRTKEFLLGHPALFLAFYGALRGWRRWTPALVTVGAIGQTSLVNTFCHIHTPLYISLFHLVNGLWLGLGIGWLLALGWDRLNTPAPRGHEPNGKWGSLIPEPNPGDMVD